jgi:hypothetical protein
VGEIFAARDPIRLRVRRKCEQRGERLIELPIHECGARGALVPRRKISSLLWLRSHSLGKDRSQRDETESCCGGAKATAIRAYLGRSNLVFGMIASLPLIRFGATIGYCADDIRSTCAARCDERRQGSDAGKAWLVPILALSLNESGTLEPVIGLIAVQL